MWGVVQACTRGTISTLVSVTHLCALYPSACVRGAAVEYSYVDWLASAFRRATMVLTPSATSGLLASVTSLLSLTTHLYLDAPRMQMTLVSSWLLRPDRKFKSLLVTSFAKKLESTYQVLIRSRRTHCVEVDKRPATSGLADFNIRARDWRA